MSLEPLRLRSMRAWQFAIIIAWIAIALLAIVNHEPWRDEAQSWLLVSELSIPELFKRLPYEGTPPLWFAILKPFAAAGAPFETQAVLAFIFSAAAVILFIRNAPFSLAARALVVFSYYIQYEYTAIARNYSLGLAALFSAATLHSRRFDRPSLYAAALAALALTSTHTLLLSMVIIAMWGYELLSTRRRVPLSWFAVAFVVVFAIGTIWPRSDASLVVSTHYDVLPRVIGAAFLPAIDHWLAPLVGGLMIAGAAHVMRRSPVVLAGYLACIAGMLAISSRWTGGLRHAGLLFIATLFFLWIDRSERSVRWPVIWSTAFSSIAGIGVVTAALFVYLEVNKSFSGAREMGKVLAQYDGIEVAAHNLTQTSAVLPHAPHRSFWYAGTGSSGSYMTWDPAWRRATELTYPEAVARAASHFRTKPHLLLLNVEMPDADREGYRPVYVTTDNMFTNFDERFWLYAPVPPLTP